MAVFIIQDGDTVPLHNRPEVRIIVWIKAEQLRVEAYTIF